MNYEIVKNECLNVIGIRYELTNSMATNLSLAKKYWLDFNEKLRVNKLYLGKNWCKYAFIIRENDKVYYFIAIPKKDYTPNKFTELNISISNYLLVVHKGTIDTLKETINVLFKELISTLNIKTKKENFIYFEKYTNSFHWNRKDSEIEIYVPIELKNMTIK